MNRIYILFFTSLLTLFSMRTNAQCEIWDLTVTQGDCDGAFFNVEINFEFANTGNEGFRVVGNGNNYGNFSYADLPITIGPLEGDGTTVYEFVAIDNQFSDCSDFGVIGPVLCGSANCEIYNLHLDPGDCNNDGTYNLWVNFQVVNPGNDFFEIFYDGELLGFYALNELPVLIEHFEDNGEVSPVITVCINDNPDCCAEGDFTAPNCTGSCHIYDLHANGIDCVGDEFYISLDFEFTNVGNDGFSVHGNGTNYGTFSYNHVPFVLGPLPADGTFYEFVVQDVNHPDCSDFIEYGVVDCSGGACDIFDLNVETGDCNNDGTYNLWINFEYTNANNDLFNVFYQNEIIGTFHLNELPVVIHNFQDNGEPNQGILVCINDNPDCCEDIGFESPNCGGGDCHIFEIFAEAHACDDDGNYLLDFNFQHENVGDDGFTAILNGEEYGPFSYGEPFYTVGPLEGGVVYELVIEDNQLNCHGYTQFGPVFCDDNCHIYHLQAEAGECDDLGQFYVTIDFDHANTGNDGFKVTGNGNVYGFFGYNELPIELGPFQSPVDDLEFIVNDAQHPDCGNYVEVDPPGCDGGNDCEIGELQVDITPCMDDGTFFAVLDFEHHNTSGIGFRVQGNGINYGIFEYDELPVSIGPLVGNGITNYEFGVRDLLFHDCGNAIGIGPVECDLLGDCLIEDLIVEPLSCNDDGTYDLWINFAPSYAGNLFFDVIYEGQVVDYFPIASLPVVLPHFHDNGEDHPVISVCVNDNPNCCSIFTYEAPDCNSPIVWPGDADFNNVADNFDLLQIGIGYESTGPSRDVQGFEWTALNADDWDHSFNTGINFKHADADGNGVIAKEDVQAISINFGQTHGEVATPVLLGGTEDDPPFFVDLPEAGNLTSGSQFFAPIILGNADLPVDDLYGIAFTLRFDPEIIDPSSIQMQYDPSWLGVADINLLNFDKTFADQGLVKVALVRTDQNNVSGYGQVAGFIGIIDNIAGKEEVKVEIIDVKAIQENEVMIPLYRPVKVVDLTTGTKDLVQGTIEVYPNPAGGTVFLHHPAGHEILSVRVENMNGMLMKEDLDRDNQLSVGELPAGIYLLKIETREGFYLERLVRL